MYDFKIEAADTATLYRDLLSAAEGLTAGEPDSIANMANVAALIWETLPDLNWRIGPWPVPGPARVHPHSVRQRGVRNRGGHTAGAARRRR